MVFKTSLSKGLDAILKGSDETNVKTHQVNMSDTRQIPVESIVPSKLQPRKTFKDKELEELAVSIKTQGIIQPIVVRKFNDSRYEVVAGERRWRAAKLAGLTEVPTIVRDLDDDAAIVVALIENIQREDLNPIEEATAFDKLVNQYGLTHEEVGKTVGKSRVAITNLIRLLTLEDEIKQMLTANQLEQGHCKVLLALSSEEQVNAAVQVVKEGLSVRQTEKLVQRYKNPKAIESKEISFEDKMLLNQYKGRLSIIPFPSKILRKSNGEYQIVHSFKSQVEIEEYFKLYE